MFACFRSGGSCAIGTATNSALDGRMRVRGVRRLRVVDASVIPSMFVSLLQFRINMLRKMLYVL